MYNFEHRFMLARAAGAIAATVVISAAQPPRLATAQEAERDQAPEREMRAAAVDSLRREIETLEARIDSLAAELRRLSGPHDDRRAGHEEPADSLAGGLAALRAKAAAAAAGAADDAPEADAEGRGLNSLNPEISVTGDILALTDFDEPSEHNFVAREFEVAFQSNLDPFSRAKIFVAHHQHGGQLEPFAADLPTDPTGPAASEAEQATESEAEHGEVEIEEGYVEWLALPLGLNATVGKFRQRFGKLNRWHTHALPGSQLPLPYVAFFGEEGLAQTGISLHWLAPWEGAGVYEVWGEVTHGGNETLFGDAGRISALAHVNAFYQLSPSTYFELGLSGIAGERGYEGGIRRGTQIAGVDFTLDWTPPGSSLYRGAKLYGGWMWARRALPIDLDEKVTATGGYLIGQYRLGRQWVAGLRFEWVENPAQPDQSAHLFAPTLTWWQSEFVRLRAELHLLQRPGDDLAQLLLQATFAMGPHKHETY